MLQFCKHYFFLSLIAFAVPGIASGIELLQAQKIAIKHFRKTNPSLKNQKIATSLIATSFKNSAFVQIRVLGAHDAPGTLIGVSAKGRSATLIPGGNWTAFIKTIRPFIKTEEFKLNEPGPKTEKEAQGILQAVLSLYGLKNAQIVCNSAKAAFNCQITSETDLPIPPQVKMATDGTLM